jgi:CheY-like chemotaxis protein
MTITPTISRSTVLVIDDTPSNIALANAILADTYDLKVANSGVRGLAIAQADPVPDLILLDMMMPGMDGMEVCRRLKESEVTRDIPVIFLSGRAGGGDEEEGLEAGAVDYIAKPLSPALLLNRVASQIELRASRRQIAQLQASAEALTWDLAECGKALHRFETTVSHDMRSALNIVNGFASLLRKKFGGEGNEQNLKSVTTIASSAKQLDGLIDSWRQIPALMRVPMQPRLLDMNALAQATIENALGGLDDSEKPQVVVEELPPSTGDETALRQVWQQLVANALNAMEGTAAPVLRIGAVIGEGEVVYSVEDNGCGFPQDEHDRLFAPLDSPKDKDKRKGPGLGLFMAEQALTRNRGRIWAAALPEGGARFSFSLPHTSHTAENFKSQESDVAPSQGQFKDAAS